MGKSYTHNHLENRARTAYEKNMEHIQRHNEDARKGKHTFEIRANSMADLSQDGYLRRFIRLKESVHPDAVPKNKTNRNVDKDDEEALLGSVRARPEDRGYIPDALDWRELGFKMEALNQETCGSCYAFSTATSIEAQVFRRTGKVVQLSAQQIVDCSVSMGNSGCSGGSLRTTLRYLQASRGLMRAVDYPYESEVRNCAIFIPRKCNFNVEKVTKVDRIDFSNKSVITSHHWQW